MRQILLSIPIALIIAINTASAQVTPADGDTINYTLTGFSVPSSNKADDYLLEIARGHFTDEKKFTQNIIVTDESTSNRTIKLLPSFNESYTWRIGYKSKSKIFNKTPLYHFKTGNSIFIDTSRYRVSVLKPYDNNNDLLIFFDNTRTLRDTRGNVVWYLPDIPGVIDSAMNVRDLKMSPDGTITFLTAKNACEINYRGKLLWIAPNDGKVSGDTSEYYHHEFTKLSNGHYMVAGNEYEFLELPENGDTVKYRNDGEVIQRNSKYYRKAESGTLIEYDKKKNVVWAWHTKQHLGKEDFLKTSSTGKSMFSSHMNSFFLNEKDSTIYIGFRDISRIMKIKYPKGNILAAYGAGINGDGIFYGQHNATINSYGNLMLFNNNVSPTHGYSNSYITILKEPTKDNDSPEKVWEFSCNIDTLTFPYSPSGGGVYELNDKSLLTCMGGTNRIFIVNRKKEVLWNALCEWKNIYTGNSAWVWQAGYRVAPIETRTELSLLIFK